MKQYSDTPITRAHNPPRASDHRAYRACLRADFRHWCAYCLADETEIGPGSAFGQFEIDHFRPQKPFGHLRTIYGNLYWSCSACNRFKKQTWPDEDEERLGYRFVDPCEDTPFEHMQIEGQLVVGKTRAGAYTIKEINLNSAEHQQRRKKREAALQLWALLRSVLATTPDGVRRSELEAACDRLLAETEGHAPPWDSESTCRCDTATSAR